MYIWFIFVIGLASNAASTSVPAKDAEHLCPQNENFESQTNRCQITCQNMPQEPYMGACVLKDDCFCDKSFVRDANGKCIDRQQCSGPLEEYNECGSACPVTCDTYNNTCLACTLQCVAGCFCKPDYVRNSAGECVKPADCPRVCGVNEHFDWCPPNCPHQNCSAIWSRIDCSNASSCCKPQCRCDDGHYRNDSGVCVSTKQCQKDHCGDHAYYTDCINPCPKGAVCIAACIPGCLCDEGYVKENGVCVEKKKCGPNSNYDKCSNCPKGAQCFAPCVAGCICDDGYMKKDGECVKEEKYDNKTTCGENEEFNQCGTACPLTCEKPKPGVCTKQCVPGCFCKENYVRDENNKCIPLTECPPPKCGEDEEYQTCGSSCPNTCDNYNDTCRICTLQCVVGCFCKDNLVRHPSGKCVKPDQCPPRICGGPNEYFDWCPPNCPHQNCSVMWSKINCTNGRECCTPQCRCKSGFFRGHKNLCISGKQCQVSGQCGDNAHYDECPNKCPEGAMCAVPCIPDCVCDNGYIKDKYGACVKKEPTDPKECGANSHYEECPIVCPPGKVCIAQCIAGCKCDDGYVWNEYEGKCVKDELPPKKCPVNETTVACANGCLNNYCPNDEPPGSKIQCSPPAKCVPGCQCQSGYYRISTNDRRCVLKEDCPKPKPVCGENEEYQTCGTACPRTCEKPNPGACTLQCVQGCFCKTDFYRNSDGKCVPYEECPPLQCPANETATNCTFSCLSDYCRETNGPTVLCKPAPCPPLRPGCRCDPGYLRNNKDENKCILEEDCPPVVNCTENEHFERCGTACPRTCDEPETKPCTEQCVRGCFCNGDLVRNKSGSCVPLEQCKDEAHCSPNAHYDKCPNSCSPGAMCKPIACKPECVCNKGFYKNKDGDCIETPIKCGKHSRFDECSIKCPPNAKCKRQCSPGCMCDVGYMKNKDGECVKEISKCPHNEEYKSCGTACPKTCKNRNVKINCIQVCKSGCFCKGNLVRNNQGICVPSQQCPPNSECGENEEYKRCGSACPPTCDNPTPDCNSTKCNVGCFCKDFHIRDKDNNCIHFHQCPRLPKCDEYEVYKTCGSACPPTCDNPTPDCNSTMCKPGCFCQDYHIRDRNNKCVFFSDCPRQPKCDENEEYKSCGSACPPTCDNPTPDCNSTKCNAGCFCKDFHIRDKNNKCIHFHQCPQQPKCDENEEYKTCGSACPPTCDIPTPDCNSTMCKPGCFCQEFHIRDKNNKCIYFSDCPPKCRQNEHFESCGTACPATCEEPFPKGCSKQCVRGCFCDNGFVKNGCNGDCIPGNNCPKPICAANETYVRCAYSCPTDYCPQNKGPVPQCGLPYPCPPGCRCKAGYLKNNRDENKCILKEKCPSICGKDEHYNRCGTACPATCDDPEPKGCTRQCVNGCFCNNGLVRNKDGNCVPVDQCPKPTKCPTNEEYKECGTACPKTCKNKDAKIKCIAKCVSGCFCKDDLVRNDTGECIPAEQCLPSEICEANEEWKDCGTACPKTCDDPKPGVCTLQCVRGCFCKEDLYRDKETNKCVPLDKCCKKDEKSETNNSN